MAYLYFSGYFPERFQAFPAPPGPAAAQEPPRRPQRCGTTGLSDAERCDVMQPLVDHG